MDESLTQGVGATAPPIGCDEEAGNRKVGRREGFLIQSSFPPSKLLVPLFMGAAHLCGCGGAVASEVATRSWRAHCDRRATRLRLGSRGSQSANGPRKFAFGPCVEALPHIGVWRHDPAYPAAAL